MNSIPSERDNLTFLITLFVMDTFESALHVTSFTIARSAESTSGA